MFPLEQARCLASLEPRMPVCWGNWVSTPVRRMQQVCANSSMSLHQAIAFQHSRKQHIATGHLIRNELGQPTSHGSSPMITRWSSWTWPNGEPLSLQGQLSFSAHDVGASALTFGGPPAMVTRTPGAVVNVASTSIVAWAAATEIAGHLAAKLAAVLWCLVLWRLVLPCLGSSCLVLFLSSPFLSFAVHAGKLWSLGRQGRLGAVVTSMAAVHPHQLLAS